MSKRQFKLKVRIPKYPHSRYEWRKEIHKKVREELKGKKIRYDRKDKLQLAVRLYFDDVKLTFVDVDNRLKDVMDALQGRVGGRGKKPKLRSIIPNDAQIYRVIVEKGSPPPQSHDLGHLTISKYTGPIYR